jgi:predicted RNase H-like nuclease (RuvC/YqgF family)
VNDTDLTALAASLAETARHLEAHIERRAQEIAEPQILAAQLRAKAQIDEQDRETRFEMQRKSDLIAELRRQLGAQVKQNERLHREVTETRGAVRRVETLHVWTNEDGKKFVFADELWAALAETGSPAARALAELQQCRADR